MKKILMLAGILASLGAPWANATVEVRVINTAGGGDTGWIACAGTSCSFVGTVGNYSLTSNISVQNLGFNPFLDLSYSATTSVTGAGTLLFETMANGYTFNTPATSLHGSGNSSLGDMITFSGYGGNNNTICPAGTNACTPSSNGSNLLESVGPLTVAQSSGFNMTAPGGGNTVNPYSLGITVTLANPTSVGTASGDIALNAVPEPASVMLLGGALLFTVSTLRRKVRHNS